MLDEIGYTLTPIEAGGFGHVRAHGEIWTATADNRIESGTPVRVTAVDGLAFARRGSRTGRPQSFGVNVAWRISPDQAPLKLAAV